MQELMHIAIELVEAMDKAADASLPQEIVNIVKLHSKLAVGSAWIPIPGADVAAGATTIWTMYTRINSKENVLKSIGAGVATNLTSYMAMSGVASAMKFIPGIGSIGGALVMSASLYAITLVSGWVYLKALTSMVKRNCREITANDFKKAIDDVMSNKDLIKRLLNVAKKEYKSN
jgi:uncharacterized protein (DUF697 family)